MVTQPNWQLLVSKVDVPARPDALWTRAVDYIAGPRKLKIVSDPGSNWAIASGNTLGPDGDPALPQNANALPLLGSALLGALIGKVGGSGADNTSPSPALAGSLQVSPGATVPQPFSIGSFCILELLATQKGSLFLTMNDAPVTFSQHTGHVTVDIFEAM